MDLKDIDLNNLGNIIKQAQKLAKEQMSSLSIADQQKVNNIIDGVDLSSIEDIQKGLNNLKN